MPISCENHNKRPKQINTFMKSGTNDRWDSTKIIAAEIIIREITPNKSPSSSHIASGIKMTILYL